ncbi:MAG: hypothetical protein K0U39_06615, partial [Alphaproteobacteria bacterium]|nr:hypothetical protein [Alphaproteobacteria bacterium]
RRIQRSIINTEYAINGNNLQSRDKYALKPKLKQLNDGKAFLVSKSLSRRNKGGILRRQFQQLNKEYEDATTDPISIRA